MGSKKITPILKSDLKDLASWFERQKRILPWRDDPSFYRVWISEIMLQQTQVITVVPYFERFLKKFPSVEKLAKAPLDEVLKQWAGLGYYSRARNIQRAAKKIVTEGWPKTRDEWLEVPGVGPYTAGAILSIAGNKPEALVDGNVERVFARLRLLDRKKMGDSDYKKVLWDLSLDSVTRAHRGGIAPSVFNQAWMELGATVCTYRNPKCGMCPIKKACMAFKESCVEEFPTKKKPKEWILFQEKYFVVFSSDFKSVLVKQTEAGEWRAGLWDFLTKKPGARTKFKVLGEIESKHIVTRHKITRTTEVLVLAQGVKIPGEWISLDSPQVALGAAPKKVLQLISERFLIS